MDAPHDGDDRPEVKGLGVHAPHSYKEGMDQSRAPILEGIEDHRRSDRYGFTPPAHRQGRGADELAKRILGESVYASDLVATGGLDTRSAANSYLADAQALMAEAVGADKVIFSTCGSSLAVKAAILAVTLGQGEVLISRDAHKSVTSALVLSGLMPRWVPPRWDAERHLAHPPSPEDLERMWQRYPDASAALVVSPTPWGTCADLAAMTEICHRRGKPLIVDEAWGAHLPFHPDLPTWAMSAGADVCVVSIHKMGMGLEQGSVLHLQGELVDGVRLAQCADVLASTSSNILLYGAIDAWRRQMMDGGREWIDRSLHFVHGLRERIAAIDGIHLMERELREVSASDEYDPFHVVVDVGERGVTGFWAADWLRAEKRIDVGVTDHRRIELTVSLADDDGTGDRLLDALAGLADAARDADAPPQMYLPTPDDLEPQTVMRPRDAFFGPVEVVPAEEAVGRVAAEQITPYPPGVPAILPGELIKEGTLRYLRTGLDCGLVIPDAGDPSLRTIRVTQETEPNARPE
jgi:arginine/lysine/ornithine decarboxylase